MSGKVKWLMAGGAGVLACALVVTLLVAPVAAQAPDQGGQQQAPGTGSPWQWPGYGPGGRMGRGGWMQPGTGPGWGPGMMGRGWGQDDGRGWGPGMMGRGMGPGTMGPWNAPDQGFGFGPCGPMGGPGWGWGGTAPLSGTNRISLDQAVEAAKQFVAASGYTDLEVTDPMEFTYNFYVQVREKSTGINAFELLVNPYTGRVFPEPGPNMMWNTKYGHMGRWWGGQPTATMAVDPETAKQVAQQYLDTFMSGATADEPETFYGYYTLHVLKDGKVVGMLSVNGTTGQVWWHRWHGDFVQAGEMTE